MLTRLWRWLFYTCDHKWAVIERAPVYLVDESGKNIGEKPFATDFVLQCEKCGNIKRKRA